MGAMTWRQRAASPRGAQLIEVALTLPIVCLMIVALVDLGLMVQRYAMLTSAAREGARIATFPGITEQDVEDRILEYLTTAGVPIAGVATETTAAQVTAGTRPLGAVRVVVTYPYAYTLLAPVMAIVTDDPAPGVTLTAAATVRLEVAAGL